MDVGAARKFVEGSDDAIYEALADAAVLVIAVTLAASGLALLLVLASATDSFRVVAACAVYGASVFANFLIAALYHGFWRGPSKAVLQAADHCSIFTLIAGTYTPIALLTLPQPLGWRLLAVMWGLAAFGIVARLWVGRMHWSLFGFLFAMGWMGMVWGATMFAHLGADGGWLLLAGGFAYSGGLVFYLWRRAPFSDALWHLCVLAGAVCHFLTVSIYAIPYPAAPAAG